jgi:PhnB protein
MMATVQPYLNFNGNCEEAFNFYKSVFGGEFTYVGRFSDMPPMEGVKPLPESESNRIMHISLPIGKDSYLLGSDTGGEWASDLREGNNIQLSVNAESDEDADRLYEALSAGGRQTMPMANTFWGSYFGMLIDKFGVYWMISREEKKESKTMSS